MREKQREAMGFPAGISFEGEDIWNCYELSWLNNKGKPIRAAATFTLPAKSPFLAESKSVKLYLNSLNHHHFSHEREVKETIERDLTELCQAPVSVLINSSSLRTMSTSIESYYCLDELDVTITDYERDCDLLEISTDTVVQERLCTHLFKSHCLVTGQPDWGSIFIEYSGAAIERTSVLKYLISYYDHVGFAENCIEQIYVDIMTRAHPQNLSVFGRFTRRGGIDINPYRQSTAAPVSNDRLIYQ